MKRRLPVMLVLGFVVGLGLASRAYDGLFPNALGKYPGRSLDGGLLPRVEAGGTRYGALEIGPDGSGAVLRGRVPAVVPRALAGRDPRHSFRALAVGFDLQPNGSCGLHDGRRRGVPHRSFSGTTWSVVGAWGLTQGTAMLVPPQNNRRSSVG